MLLVQQCNYVAVAVLPFQTTKLSLIRLCGAVLFTCSFQSQIAPNAIKKFDMTSETMRMFNKTTFDLGKEAYAPN